MEVRHILKAMLKRWWLVLIPALVVSLYTLVTYTPPPVTYQVGMRFATGTEPADTLSEDYDRYYAWLTSEYVANGLADVVSTNAFAVNVQERLAADYGLVLDHPPYGAFAGDNTQSITVIYVTWANRDEIKDIANAVTAELLENAGVYYPQMAGIGEVARRLDDPVKGPPVGTSLRAQLTGPALRIALALALGAGLAVLVYVLDPRVHVKDDVETLGVRVLGCVPR